MIELRPKIKNVKLISGDSGCLSLTATTSAVAASSSQQSGTPPTVLTLADTTADGIKSHFNFIFEQSLLHFHLKFFFLHFQTILVTETGKSTLCELHFGYTACFVFKLLTRLYVHQTVAFSF